MRIVVTKVYTRNGNQSEVECILYNSDNQGTRTRYSLKSLIQVINTFQKVECENFMVVNNSFIRGKKGYNLKMEEVESLSHDKRKESSYDKVRKSNREQRECNRAGFIGVETGTSSEGIKRGVGQVERRGYSTECAKRPTNRCNTVQNDARNGVLVGSDGISVIPVCSPQQFLRDFSDEHSKMEFAPCVDTHNLHELMQMQCYGHKDLGFFAVSRDGNICSVLKSSKNKKAGFTKDIMINALRHGGDRLDCFAINNGGLVEFYMKCGFIPVCRLKFNQEYAPDGWKHEWGTPDVVFMMHNLDTADEVLSKYGTYDSYKKYLDTHEVPYFGDYDKAGEFRDKLLFEAKNGKYGKGVKGMFNCFKKVVSDLKV